MHHWVWFVASCGAYFHPLVLKQNNIFVKRKNNSEIIVSLGFCENKAIADHITLCVYQAVAFCSDLMMSMSMCYEVTQIEILKLWVCFGYFFL